MYEHNRDQSSKPEPIAAAPTTRCRRNISIFRSLLPAVLFVPAVFLLTGGSGAGAGGAAVTSQSVGGSSPIANWEDDFNDDLDDTGDDLHEASLTIGTSEGPLSEPDLSLVEGRLDLALDTIDRILDPNQYPSLDPPEAGSVDTNVNPTTLEGYARECLNRIQDARDELNSNVVDHKVIGTHLRTIRHLITRSSPHSYRSVAGITSGGS